MIAVAFTKVESDVSELSVSASKEVYRPPAARGQVSAVKMSIHEDAEISESREFFLFSFLFSCRLRSGYWRFFPFKIWFLIAEFSDCEVVHLRR